MTIRKGNLNGRRCFMTQHPETHVVDVVCATCGTVLRFVRPPLRCPSKCARTATPPTPACSRASPAGAGSSVSTAGARSPRHSKPRKAVEHSLHRRDRLLARCADLEHDLSTGRANRPVGKRAALTLQTPEPVYLVLDAALSAEAQP